MTAYNQTGKHFEYINKVEWQIGHRYDKQENSQIRSKKAFHVIEGAAEREDKYAFVVGGQHKTGELSLKVGGVDLGNVLIDSGTLCNLIDSETQNILKQRHIECESKKSNKKLFAYGQREPIISK